MNLFRQHVPVCEAVKGALFGASLAIIIGALLGFLEDLNINTKGGGAIEGPIIEIIFLGWLGGQIGALVRVIGAATRANGK